MANTEFIKRHHTAALKTSNGLHGNIHYSLECKGVSFSHSVEEWSMRLVDLIPPSMACQSFRSRNTGRLTQISTRPSANKHGCIKCRSHVPLPVVPTQGVIQREGGYLKKSLQHFHQDWLGSASMLMQLFRLAQ